MTSLSAQQLWEAALGQLQLQIARPSYETWLKNTRGILLQGTRLVVGTPTPFAAEWLEKRMYQLIESTVQNITRIPTQVYFQVCSPPSHSQGWQNTGIVPSPNSGGQEQRPLNSNSHPQINARYTFDSFVIGSSNQLAHAAAMAVAEQPGTSYNPLFIYSGTGLGKTHLLHAIAQEVSRKGLDYLYVSSEHFTNAFISAIRERKTREFRRKYCEVEVLLIDDIQFISGKEQTQEGFFHIFNDLHLASRQIVIASDRPPQAMPLLEERLRSRFAWGLMADIQPPTLEMRLAILQHKAQGMGLHPTQESMEFIAQKAQKNIRELEGSLNRVMAMSQLTAQPITLDLVSMALANVVIEQNHSETKAQDVINIVANFFNVSRQALIGKRRDRRPALARQVAMYLLHEEAQEPFSEIGRLIGGRDHSTVIYACNRIANKSASDSSLRQDLLTIKNKLHSR